MEVRSCSSCETPYHRSCLRELAGCSTLGCERQVKAARVSSERAREAAGSARIRLEPSPRPSPAREAAAASESTYEEASVRVRLGLALAMVCSWLTLPTFWPLGFACVAAAAALLWRIRRRGLACLALAGSPVVVLPLIGVLSASVGYLTGTAAERPGFSAADLDPSGRRTPESSGEPASELLSRIPYDLTLRGWRSLFAYLQGTTPPGPLPSYSQARALLAERGHELRWRDLEAGQLVVDGVALKPSAELSQLNPFYMGDARDTLRALVLGGRYLVASSEKAGRTLVLDLESQACLVRWEHEVEDARQEQAAAAEAPSPAGP